MILQLSSGIGGPAECGYAVGGIFKALRREHPDIELLEACPMREPGCYRSIRFSTARDLSALEGTMLWVCQSPLCPHRRRKNWYIMCRVIPDAAPFDGELRREDVRFERFHSGGPGGQNVNKVETGVRLTHMPTGIVVSSTTERTQHANRRVAEQKLRASLADRTRQTCAQQAHDTWHAHGELERGNPVRIYREPRFELS